MTPPAGVRDRVRPRPLHEEAMEGFRDTFDHPYELVVGGRQDRALCHKVANGRRGVAETERKRRRGAPCRVFRREGEAARVFLGWLGSREDAGSALKPPVVEADGGIDWMAAWANANSPPTVTMKSRSPKHTCTPGTQLITWLAIRGLVWNAQKPLPGAPTIYVSNKHQLVNL